jgi:nucleoside-diphosphate-sugar epimerase
MKVLIVGNLGYLGPIVVRHVRNVRPDATLVGFDAGFFAGCLLDPRQCPEVILDSQHYGDVRTPPAHLFDGVDAVVQLAAISNDPMGNAFEKATEQINAVAVAKIANMAREAGARAFIFASSCSVYGAGGSDAKSETAALNPLTAYARSKIAAERALEPLATDDFRITCLRFATACGFSDRIRLDLVLNDFVASALTIGEIVILSDGTPWRPLIHVKDMARAIEWAMLRPASNGGRFLVVNAGSTEWNYQVRELAESVREYLGNVAVSVNPNAAPDKRSYRVDFARFRELAPQHQPRMTLPLAVADIADGLRACHFQDAAFRQSNYIRLKVLSELRSAGRLSEELFWQRAAE